MPDAEDAAGEVLFPSNSSLPPPHLHLTIAERIEEWPDLGTVIIPAELKKVNVPCDFDNSRPSRHVLICRDELVDAIFKNSSIGSEALNVLKDQISLETGHWDSPDSSRDDKK